MTTPKTYLIEEDIALERQEGDSAALRFLVPDIISLTGMTIRFEVKTRRTPRDLIFAKQGNVWTVSGQVITASMAPADTRGKAGVHRWECQINNALSTKLITIGRGNFTITPELIVEP